MMGLRGVILTVGLVALAAGAGSAAEKEAGREIPAPFAPFEYLIGSWKGSGVPAANRVRGWGETHAWAWKFEKGVPVGLTLTFQGDKALTRGQLAFDQTAKRFRLTGVEPGDRPVTFVGALDARGKTLTLDRVGATPLGAKQRLTLTPNANFVRYTLTVAEQEPGAPQFKRSVEVGLTKEGEAFAAGGAAADLPKCVVTGGAATLSVSYQGKTFPLCCTGCRDEFTENPEKYVKKLALRSASGSGKPVKPASAAANKDDGSFDGLADDPKPAPPSAPAAAAPTPPSRQPTSRMPAAAKPAYRAAKAASILTIGRNLERSGKPAAALPYYREVAKDFPETPAAKSAAARVKALSPP